MDEVFSELALKRLGQAAFRPSCQNTCAEEGERERKAQQQRIEDLRSAIAKGQEVREKALKNIDEWRAEIQALQLKTPELAAAVEAAKPAAEAQREKDREAQKARDEEREKARLEAEEA